jgi:hypothetical protein
MTEILSLALPDDHAVQQAIGSEQIERGDDVLELDETLLAEVRQILDEAARLAEPGTPGRVPGQPGNDSRAGGTPPDVLAGEHHPVDRATPDGSHTPDDRYPTALSPEEIAREAMTRLAAAPALSAADLRVRGGDPRQQHLIRLDGQDGPRFPLFQFDAAGRPHQLVLSINALLDADSDPWGVADWWLGPHAWLDQTPAESIGQISDHVLLATAQAMIEAG